MWNLLFEMTERDDLQNFELIGSDEEELGARNRWVFREIIHFNWLF